MDWSIFMALWIFVTALGVVWFALCNERTFRERIEALDRVQTQADAWVLAELRRVGYDAHSRARLALRDPWRLYSPEFRRWRRTWRGGQ